MKPLITIQSISRFYQMGQHTVKALNNVSFNIQKGEFVSIVGSSGSGKSTLMNILGCLDTPTEGEYHLADNVIADTDDDKLSDIRNRHIGFVFQQFNLLHDLTVEENISLPLAYQGIERDERLRRAKELTDKFQLSDRLHHKPYELSGGQAQRVAIMRALITNPDILLLDEPTGALDSKTGREIMDIFHELHETGLTIIMVTHDNNLANEGTRCIRLKDGEVIEDSRSGEEPEPQSETISKHESGVGGLSWQDLFRVGIREGLLTHKLRSALTMLGIIIGVASVIAMSSFSLGSKQKQLMQIRELGVNLINIKDSRLEGERLNEARAKGSNGLTLQDLELIKSKIKHIERVTAYREIQVRLNVGGSDVKGSAYGVFDNFLSVNNIVLSQGHMFSEMDHVQGNRVAIIGSHIAEHLPLNKIIGEQIFLGSNPYTIVGILENKHVDTTELEASGGTDLNKGVLVPLSTMLLRTASAEMRSELDAIQLQLDNEDNLDSAGLATHRLLQAAHNGVSDFSIEVPLDLLKQKQQSQRLLDVLTLCVSSISLIVGGIGIMNIMLASVTERLKEIGIRRAIGATRSDVKMQFLTESVTLSIAGGIVGILFAFLVVFIVGYSLDIPPVFSPVMISISVCAALGTGLVFGLYPAMQASEKSPVEILRNE